jgi:hypothetical protein
MSWNWMNFIEGVAGGAFIGTPLGLLQYRLVAKFKQWRIPKPPTLPEPLSREQYRALPEEEKQARHDQFKAYCDFYDPDYPRREQLTSGNQRYADSQRVEGLNPPGIYC